ncbi:glycoside hydrolase family 36 protein [Lentzea aerocolonigenes]|uniref:glycoside hydrolase family 36 protein n=1 Tax=Lentzea aerocolonigenes TaxID=68170 RepID=UPI000ACCC554|nr:glycoside hydrolase family 36 protein [Lentzea aerocolonigenes]MCP2246636.1 alpha-galactosidase [Lentzea aerocolonigenes]
MISIESSTGVTWGHSALELVLDVAPDGAVAVRSLSAGGDPAGSGRPFIAQPLVEVLVAGHGRARVSHRFSETAVGRRMVYAGSARRTDGKWSELHVDLRDEQTGLVARTVFRSVDGVAACQITTTVTNSGPESLTLLGLTSFAAGFPAKIEDLDVVRADSEWLGEGRWTRRPLRENAVSDLNLKLHGQDGRGSLKVVSTGTWSTGTVLPTGGLVDRRTNQAWLWQIEHNGPWRWEVAERLDGAYLALLGPTDIDHQWQRRLLPGESFTSVPVSVSVSRSGVDGAIAALTEHRREIVRPHRDRAALPVVFNDYMNTIMGDPTTEKLLPLVDAAAAAGAEVFCIDAGWYDNGSSWWDSVGEWQPSETRFPRGIEEVIAHIRDLGLVPGLWLEPEVIGVRSPMAERLPEAAFLQRGGVRLVEHGRYHLDLRHPRATKHLDDVVDRLVGELDIGYFKLDYNIDAGAGTDVASDSPGAGLLAANRAHLAWLDGVLDRHPGLILENCASGAMRMDYAMMARMQLQSTSDQQDPLRYPPIAVAAPMSLLPEQSASWAYPQPDMSDEEIAFTLCTGMLGRLYLSGRLDLMTATQLESVRAAVRVHQKIRADLATSVPLWPRGLPAWDDSWLSLALTSGDVTYLAVWQRDSDQESVTLPLPHLRNSDIDLEVLYPRDLPEWTSTWDGQDLTLTAQRLPASARLYRITTSPTTSPEGSTR